MKLTTITLYTILFAGVTLSSCKKGCTDDEAYNYDSEVKKDDGSCTYLPTITLNGDESITLGVGSTYSELGATAVDNDGTTIEVTTDNSSVNTNQVGSYTVTYSATNSTGTEIARRTVIVEINQSSMTGDWTVDCPNCGTTSFPLTDPTVGPTSGTTDGLDFSGFFTLVGGTATSTISGTTITFPQQSISITGGTIDFSGAGTINATGDEITVNFSYDNTVPLIGGSGTATATYSKQ